MPPLPWYKQPSPYWLMPYGSLLVLCIALTSAPKPELLLDLACVAHPPPTAAPASSALCRRDVGVQKHAARITMGMTLMSGSLAVLTTGWWGTLSDRIGRCKVMAAGQTGVFLADSAFLVVASHSHVVSTAGEWTMYIGPVLQGFFGGTMAYNVALTAYLADVAGGRSMASYLAMVVGFVRIGAIVGPTLGTLLIKASRDILMPFKVAVGLHAVLIAVVLFIIPESLSAEERERLAKAAEDSDEPAGSWTARLLAPFAPLRIFNPYGRPTPASARGHYNLLVLAFVSFIVSLVKGIDPAKIQYATLVLHWTQEQFGPFLSFVETCRVVILVGLVPVFTRVVKPYFEAPPTPTEETPLVADSPEALHRGTPRFDYCLWVLCLAIEVAGYMSLGANGRGSATVYVVASSLHAFAAPIDAALGSLMLSIAPPGVTSGKLFGAYAVLDALSLSFLSAPLWGTVFMRTIESYPAAMFLLAAALMATAGAISVLVRIR